MSFTYAVSRFGFRSSGLAGCARERGGGYELGSVGRSVPLPLAEDVGAVEDLDEGLSEPAARLAQLLDVTDAVDRTQLRLVETLIEHRATIEAHSGLPVDVTLSQQGRFTRSDRRMLRTAADMLAVLPQTRDAWRAGLLSWPQIRIIVQEARRLPGKVLSRFDLTVAQAAGEYHDCEPDELVARVRQLVDTLRPERDADRDRRNATSQFVALRPFPDGAGGGVYGEYGSLDYATIVEALSVGLDLSELLPTIGPDGKPDRDAIRHNRDTLGALRAARLVQICHTWLAGFRPPGTPPAGHAVDGDPDGNCDGDCETPPAGPSPSPTGPSGPAGGCSCPAPTAPARPTMFISATLDSLRGASNAPAVLLTRLAGGQLKVSARTARKLITDLDVDVRLLLINQHGDTIGVGRKHREPPGWVKDAIHTQFPTCTAPGCDRPSRTCDLDHHIDWNPNTGGGRTDLDNLAPTCRPHHGTKTRGDWTITATAHGDRIWRHHPTGLTIRKPPPTANSPSSTSHPPPTDRPADRPE